MVCGRFMCGVEAFCKWRANERRAELVRALPSAVENIELVKIRATYKVAIS